MLALVLSALKGGQPPNCILGTLHSQYKWKQRKSHPARSSRNWRTTSIRSICRPVIRLWAECHRYQGVNHHFRHTFASPNHPPKKKTAPRVPRIPTPNAGDQYPRTGNRYPRYDKYLEAEVNMRHGLVRFTLSGANRTSKFEIANTPITAHMK